MGYAVNHPDDAACSALWSAVIYLAIKDMDTYNERRPAINWVFSDDTGVGSMRWICDMLDLDYERLLHLATSRTGRKRILTGKWMNENV